MPEFRHDAANIRALVRDDEVHRDVYVDPQLFELEMERLWHSAWIYVGHDSQVPNAGDFYAATIARQPLLMLRGSDGAVRVLLNRCAHKGAKIVGARAGNCGKAASLLVSRLDLCFGRFAADRAREKRVRRHAIPGIRGGTRFGFCRGCGHLSRLRVRRV